MYVYTKNKLIIAVAMYIATICFQSVALANYIY